MTTDKTGNVSYPDFRRARREDPSRIRPDQAQIIEADLVSTTNAKILAALTEAVALLEPARAEIQLLRKQLLEAKEAHRELASKRLDVEMRAARAKSELDGALAVYADFQRQTLRDEILRQDKQRNRPWWRFGRWIPLTRSFPEKFRSQRSAGSSIPIL